MEEEITFKDLQSEHYSHYVILASFTILYYDYFLTVSWEVERVWKTSRLNWASVLFYLNRYVCLLGHIPVLFQTFWSTSNPRKHKICRGLQTYHQGLAVLIQAIVACMLVMRVYALWGGRRSVLFLYVLILVSALITGSWALVVGISRNLRRDVDLPFGCGANLTRFVAIRSAVAWGSMFIFDCLIFSMTVYKSVTLPRLRGSNLVNVLFRDGAIYFGVIATSNLTNILSFLLGNAFTRGIMTVFTNVISSVMISRLVLNLRHPSLVSHARRTSQPDMTDELAYPDLTFTGQTELSQPETTIQNTRRQYNLG